ncbi:MAG: hypothetical protein NXH75_18085, partial [Halobacteriovoraceae bacterium]|nr:hypothetical protein [Halobacteriovoraceae bacterium]
PSFYSIKALPKDLKLKARHEILLLQKELILKYDIQGAGNLIKQLSALIKFMDSEDHSEEWSEFVVETKKVDGIRKESFIDVFPEFIGYF